MEKETKKTILLIEDEEVLRIALKFKLEKSGFVVLEAGDGEKALEILKAATPDLILLDVLLPKLGGEKILNFIRQNKNTSLVPVIVITQLFKDELFELIPKEQINDYIVKTETPIDEIISRIRKLL